MVSGLRCERPDRALGAEDVGFGLEQDELEVVRSEGREQRPRFVGVEVLHGDLLLGQRPLRVGSHPAVWCANQAMPRSRRTCTPASASSSRHKVLARRAMAV